jgi:hypothetical protein
MRNLRFELSERTERRKPESKWVPRSTEMSDRLVEELWPAIARPSSIAFAAGRCGDFRMFA